MALLDRISNWLQAPRIPDPVDRRNAPMLQLALLTLGILPPALWLYRILAIDIAWRTGETTSLLASLSISALALWSVVLIRRGRFRRAMRQLMVVVAVVTVASYALSGLASHAFEMPVLLMWLFIAGMMIGRRELWTMYAALVLAMLSGAAADMRLHAEPAGQAFGDATVRSVMFLLIALVIDRSVMALREHLRETLARDADLRRANARLRREMDAREQAQEQLLQAQKMEAIGRMASGVAHDFGHLLTLIGGYAEQSSRASSPDARDAALEGLRSATGRARALVQKMLHFARSGDRFAETIDAGAALREIAPMLRQTLGPAIRFALDTPPAPAPVHIDPEQFALALLNLAANARDAMPDGGRFSLSAHGIDGKWLDILARDDGEGVPEALRARIFDPFFTTKPPGHGIGLGLSASREMAEAAGGRLDLVDTGTGSTFRLRLPLRTDADGMPPAAQPNM